MTKEEEIMSQAKVLVRQEKKMDFLNDPKLFFNRLRFGYYEERVLYHVRWILAKSKGKDIPFFDKTSAEEENSTGEL